MIELFSTCPRSNKIARSRFLDCVADVAQWSERAGCRGMFVPADSTLVDPWMLADVIARHSTTLWPVIAVQPAYTHPFCVAKQVASFAYLYGRRLGLNIAGWSNGDAAESAHAVEFATTLRRVFDGDRSAAFDGGAHVKLAPPLAKSLKPAMFVSNATTTGAAAADGAATMTHIGVITRESSDHAWTIARSRFPCERRRTDEDSPIWLMPMRDYDAGRPYLVGSYDIVAAELERYLSSGCRTFVVDVPIDPEELEHIQIAFARAQTTSAATPVRAEMAATA